MHEWATSTDIHQVFQGQAARFTIFDAIAACAEAGFEKIDLTFCRWCEPGMPVSGDNYQRFGEQIAACLEAHHIAPAQAHANFYLHNVSQEEDARSALMSRRCLALAGMLGVPAVVMHILRVRDIGTDDKTIGMQKNVEYFKPYGDIARACGVKIAIENGLTGFYHSADELLELIDRLGDDAFGLCWDTGHANITGQPQEQAILKMGARLLCVHLNDNDGKKDQHLLPCMGTVDFSAVMRALRQSGYAGAFSLECGGFTRNLPASARPAALKLARDVCAAL